MGSERSESQGQGKLRVRGPRVNAVSKHWGLAGWGWGGWGARQTTKTTQPQRPSGSWCWSRCLTFDFRDKRLM